MSIRICVEFGPDEAITFPDGFTSVEMEMVRDWTKGSIDSKPKFFQAISREDNEALKALRLIGRKRKGAGDRFDSIVIDYDLLEPYFIDADGREVEPDVVLDSDGDVVLKNRGDDKNPVWEPKAHKNADGSDRWKYTDSGEPVPVENPTRRRRRTNTATSSATTPATP